MSKLNTKTGLWTIPMPTIDTYCVICSKKRGTSDKELYIITGIDEKDYNRIKRESTINIQRGKEHFSVVPDDVVCYGEIDYREGSEDCEILDSFNWLDDLVAKGISIPSDYNYDNHECVSPKHFIRWSETFVISKVCRYLHGRLGKPKYSLIFREAI